MMPGAMRLFRAVALSGACMSGLAVSAAAQAADSPRIVFAAKPHAVDFPVRHSVATFFQVGDKQRASVEVHMLTPQGDAYATRYAGTIPYDGATPQIESVFLFNADDDPELELFVVARWDVSRDGGKTKGKFYRTYVFDQKPSGKGLLRLHAVEDRIGSGLVGVKDGKPASFDRKDPDAIRGLLKSLGY